MTEKKSVAHLVFDTRAIEDREATTLKGYKCYVS